MLEKCIFFGLLLASSLSGPLSGVSRAQGTTPDNRLARYEFLKARAEDDFSWWATFAISEKYQPPLNSAGTGIPRISNDSPDKVEMRYWLNGQAVELKSTRSVFSISVANENWKKEFPMPVTRIKELCHQILDLKVALDFEPVSTSPELVTGRVKVLEPEASTLSVNGRLPPVRWEWSMRWWQTSGGVGFYFLKRGREARSAPQLLSWDLQDNISWFSTIQQIPVEPLDLQKTGALDESYFQRAPAFSNEEKITVVHIPQLAPRAQPPDSLRLVSSISGMGERISEISYWFDKDIVRPLKFMCSIQGTQVSLRINGIAAVDSRLIPDKITLTDRDGVELNGAAFENALRLVQLSKKIFPATDNLHVVVNDAKAVELSGSLQNVTNTLKDPITWYMNKGNLVFQLK